MRLPSAPSVLGPGFSGSTCSPRTSARLVSACPGEGKALLISNSYGGAVQRQLATQFAELEKASALWQGYAGPNLEGLLQDCDADTVVFVANPTDYMTAAAVLPDFFSGDAAD